MSSTPPAIASTIDAFHEAYLPLKTLGRGSASVVWHVAHRLTHVPFAAKVISRDKYNPVEVDALRTLRHPHIVELHEVYETDEEVVLVMELVEGGDLFSLCSREERVSEAVAARFVRGLLLALEAAHDMHIVHCDVKLENLLLTDAQEVKLIDFGLSQYERGRSLTSCRGSQHYISPEIVKSTRTQHHVEGFLPSQHSKYGKEVDVWAVGVVMYVLLTGTYPFRGSRTMECMRRILRATYDVPTYLSDEASSLLRQLLEPSAEDRITVVAALCHPWIGGSGGGGMSAGITAGVVGSTPPRKRTPPLAAPVGSLRSAAAAAAPADSDGVATNVYHAA